MPIIRFNDIKNQNVDTENNTTLFVRGTGVVESRRDVLEVPFTHEAYLIKQGRLVFYNTEGMYRILENRDEIRNWKKGDKVDVIYIPRDTLAVFEFGTRRQIEYKDPISNILVHVGTNGRCNINIVNRERFVRRVVGVTQVFNTSQFFERFLPEFVEAFTQAYLDYVEETHITYDQFDHKKREIAKRIETELHDKFEEDYGIHIDTLILNQIVMNNEDRQKVEAYYQTHRRNQ